MKDKKMMQILTLTIQIKLQSIMRDSRSIMNSSEMIEKRYLKNMESQSKVKLNSKEKRDNSRDLKSEHRDNSKESNVKGKSNKKKEKLEKLN